MRNHIGPYQRPAPPKRPLGLNKSKAGQKPTVPIHEIEARAKVVLQGMIERVRKPGRPLVLAEPMTAAERQARRRRIQEALRISDATGKSHAEFESGGWSSRKCDVSIFVDEPSSGKRVNPHPTADHGNHAVHLRGLEIGDEDLNRRLFAENELRKMVWESFNSPAVSPSAHWVARHGSGTAIVPRSPSLILTCKVCGDAMESIDDAAYHLRAGHRQLICEWFARLNPPREFRDMNSYVTIAMPRSRKSVKNQAISAAR